MEDQMMQPQETENVSQENHEQDFTHNSPENNLQKMREAKEAAERRAAEIAENQEKTARELEALKAQFAKIQQAPSDEPEPRYEGPGDDELVEWKHHKQQAEKIKKLEQKFQEQQKVASVNAANARLIAENPDYNKVMTDDNIAKLIKEYPEYAASLNANSDPYLQHKAAYRMLKQTGIYQEKTFEPEKEQMKKNANKPLPAQAIGGKGNNSPLTSAHLFASNGMLTEDMKQELRRINEINRRRL